MGSYYQLQLRVAVRSVVRYWGCLMASSTVVAALLPFPPAHSFLSTGLVLSSQGGFPQTLVNTGTVIGQVARWLAEPIVTTLTGILYKLAHTCRWQFDTRANIDAGEMPLEGNGWNNNYVSLQGVHCYNTATCLVSKLPCL